MDICTHKSTSYSLILDLTSCMYHHESKSKDGFGLEIDDVYTSETST